MTSHRKTTRLVHEGEYVAEVDIELIESEDEWAPYLSLADVRKLDAVREALRHEDLARASKYARVYKLLPVVT